MYTQKISSNPGASFYDEQLENPRFRVRGTPRTHDRQLPGRDVMHVATATCTVRRNGCTSDYRHLYAPRSYKCDPAERPHSQLSTLPTQAILHLPGYPSEYLTHVGT